MKILNKQELTSLQNALMDVQQFIRKVNQQRTPYYYLQFEKMIHNIGIYLYTDDTDMYKINEILLRDWLNANHRLLGIPGDDWNCGKTVEETGEIYRFFELIAAVEVYFQDEYEMEEDF